MFCRTPFLNLLYTALIALLMSIPVFAQDESPPQTLFTNVNVFDGRADELQMGVNVLVEGKVIKTISAEAISAPDATVIAGNGFTLMPGLIDMHSHLALSATSLVALESSTWEALGARTALVAEETLMDGFTTVRDAGGMNGKGVKKMIDTGELVGPRIFPSGGFIGATNSHSDFRLLTMRTPGIDAINDSNLSRHKYMDE